MSLTMKMFVELNSRKNLHRNATLLSVEPVRKLIVQQKNGNFTEYTLITENFISVETLSDVLAAI